MLVCRCPARPLPLAHRVTMIRIFTNLRAILSSILLAINDGGAVERAAVSLMVRISLSFLVL
jgi:hypothetical protein